MWCDFMVDIFYELCMLLVVLCGELEVIQDGVCKFTLEMVVFLQVEVGILIKLVDDFYQLLMFDEGVFVY